MDEAGLKKAELQTWRDAVESVNHRLWHRNMIIHYIELSVMMIILSAFMISSGNSLWWLLLFPGTLLAFWLITRGWRVAIKRAAAGKPVNLLHDARIAERMWAGEITGNELYDHSPWPFRMLIKPRNKPTPVQVAERVVFALNWYTGPPRQFFPRQWAVAVIAAALAVIAVAVVPSTGLQIQDIMDNWFFVLIALTFLSPSGSIINPSALVLTDEFDRLAKQAELSETQEIAAPASENRGAEPALPTSHNIMLTAINQLAQDMSSPRMILFRPYILLPSLTSIVVLGTGLAGDSIFGFVILPMLVLIAFIPLMYPEGFAKHFSKFAIYRRRIRVRLRESDLLVQLADGEIGMRIERLNVPWLFRRLIYFPTAPRDCADNLRRGIWLAAHNLDWLLDPPEKAERNWWYVLVAQHLGLVAAVIFGTTYIHQVFTSSHLMSGSALLSTLGVMAAYGLAIPGFIHDINVAIWREELLDCLREYLRE